MYKLNTYIIFIPLIILTALSINISTASASLTDGLVAHYTFDDSTNDFAGSNNGVASGGPSYVDGQIGKAIQLDGVDDYINLGSSVNSTLSKNNDFSISAWFKPTTLTSGSYYTILGSMVDANNRTFVGINNSKRVSVGVYDNGVSLGYSNGQTTLSTNVWYHIVMTKSGSTISGYLNGVSFTGTVVQTLSSSVGTTIGARTNLADYFPGLLDDVRVYNRVLTTTEVTQLYNETNVSADTTENNNSNTDTNTNTNNQTNTDNTTDPNPSCPSYSGITEFYVSSNGLPDNCGTKDSPWDLVTALKDNTVSSNKNSVVKPGSTIWLRGGDYTGSTIRSKLTGSSNRYINLRQYPKERARLLGLALFAEGEWVNYIGFEMAGTDTKRHSTGGGQNPTDVNVLYPFTFVASHVRAINLIIHDYNGLGISNFSASSDSEMYGNLVYYNGWVGTDRPHGPGIYSQNSTGKKSAIDNIVFSNFATGLQIYGSSAASVNNYSIIGNTLFNNGQIDGANTYHNFYIGGGAQSRNLVFNNNYIYTTPSLPSGANLIGDNVESPTDAYDLSFKDNYIVDFTLFYNWQDLIVTGNTFVKLATANIFKLLTPSTVPSYTWDNNKYYTLNGAGFQLADLGQGNGLNRVFATWKSLTGFDTNSTVTISNPTINAVFVRSNKYESGRANITIFNWENKNSVSVDISSVDIFDEDGDLLGKGPLLQNGDQYEIHNTQDYFGDVTTGTYSGGPLLISMTGHTVAKPLSVNTPSSTFPQFGTFVLLKTSGSNNQTYEPIAEPITSPTNASCSTRLNRCTTGTVSGRTSNTTHNLWTCNGLNGGTNASCSTLKTVEDPVNPIVPVDPLPTPPPPITNPLTPTYTPAYTPVHTPTPYTYKKPVTPAPKVISPTPDLPPSPSFEPLDFIPTDYIQILLDLIKQFIKDFINRIKKGIDRIIG